MGRIIDHQPSSPHALLVPSRGQGHINGAFQLAQSLAPLGFDVTFVYFSTIYSQLKEQNRLVQLPNPPQIGEAQPSASPRPAGIISIRVVDDGFQPGDSEKHFFVTPAMKENLHELILELREEGHPPTCLISDSFIPFTVEVSKRAGIPRVEFWSASALSHLFVTHLATLYSEGILPLKGSPSKWKQENPVMLDHIPGLPPFSSQLMPSHIVFSDTSSPMVKFFLEVGASVKDGERILIHSMQQLEPNAFRAFQVQGISAYAIGPLPNHTEKQHAEQAECISWLDSQAESSVMYVAFGSAASLSVEELRELAMGLEASGHPFLWVIREDNHKREELSQVLPDGFLKRTSGRGMIISWAPQVEVLAHKALGGFLSHAGWNSTLESMWAGVPMLCCPRFAEQRLNTDYLCNVWGAGVELGRTDEGGLERSMVEAGVRALMHSEGGMRARRKAEEIREMARKNCQAGGQSFSNLQTFYDDMKELSREGHASRTPAE